MRFFCVEDPWSPSDIDMRTNGKKILLLVLAMVMTFSLVSCGKRTVSESEVAEYHQHEAELKERLVGKTWHQEDEPYIAYYFDEDGTYIEYTGTTIQWTEVFNYDVRFGSWAASDFYGENLLGLEEDRLQYYEYGIVASLADREDSKPFFDGIEFDGDTLVWGNRCYSVGFDWPYKIPDDATADPFYTELVLWDEHASEYYMFYSDGTGFMCNTIFDMTNEIWGAQKFYWGVFDGNLFMAEKTEYHDEIVDDVQAYSVERVGSDFQFTNLWDGSQKMVTDAIEDPVGYKLMHNYDQIHTRIEDWE